MPKGKTDETPSISADMLVDLEINTFLKRHGYTVVAGVDEAGRGPLAGPVVAAAVILPGHVEINGLNDSKKLTEKQRLEVYEEIASLDVPIAIGMIDSATIDQINILRASLMAMRSAICKLKHVPQCILVDGNQKVPNMAIPQMTIVSGDSRCPSIAAASIIAKVTRDQIMRTYAEIYTDFSFSEHFGYPTPRHLQELKRFGPTPIHRRSFKPVADVIESKGIPQLAALL